MSSLQSDQYQSNSCRRYLINKQIDIEAAIASVKQQTSIDCSVDVALVLGSGLGSLVDTFKVTEKISYENINGFAHSTAPSHQGNLILASFEGLKVAVFQGRFHMYEAWSPKHASLPVALSHGLGAKQIIITNAVGALNPDFEAGEIMSVTDHINLTGCSPLIGINDDSIGPRFPDMSQAYDQSLRAIADEVFNQQSIKLHQGIYVGVMGPELETSAQRRYLRQIGGDAVGMSLVMETIAANHCGLKVLALSAITNSATGAADQQVDTIEEVLATAEVCAQKLAQTLPLILRKINDN